MNRSKISSCVACCLVWCWCLVAGQAEGHPFHVSFAEAEWNATTRRLEVALHVNANDLERAIRRQHDRPVSIDDDADDEVRDYLTKHFRVRHQANQNVSLTWIGYETTAKEAWLYFEIQLPDGVAGIKITNRVLLDDVAEQANTLLIEDGERRTTLEFTAEDSTHEVIWDEPAGL